MSKGRVSAKTHTQKQLDDYANQHNPNNKAYRARVANDYLTRQSSSKIDPLRKAKERAEFEHELGLDGDIGWYCYSNPYDFD